MNELASFVCGLFGGALGAALPLLILGVAVVFLVNQWLQIDWQLRNILRRLAVLEEQPPTPLAVATEDTAETEEVGLSAESAQQAPGDDEAGEPSPGGDPEEDDASAVGASDEPPPPKSSSFPLEGISLPSPEKVAMWIGAILGAFALIIGTLLAMVAVIEAGWFGPAARVSIGLISGTGVWCLGALLRLRVPVLGSALSGVGMATLFGALFAANSFYDLIGPTTTFALLVGVVIAATLRAAVRSDRFLAHLGLLGGLLTPVLVSTGNNAAVGLFSYLFLLVTGVCIAAAWRGWFDVVLGAALGSGLIYAGWTVTWYAPDSTWIALVAAVALSLPFAAVASRDSGEDWQRKAMVGVATVGAGCFALLAVPWLIPVDPVFYDPRTGLQHVQNQGPALAVSAATIAALPAPMWLAARLRESWWRSLVVTLALAVPLMAWTIGWTAHLDGPDPLLFAGLVAPVGVATLTHMGSRRTGWGWVLLPALVGLLLAGPVLTFTDGPGLALSAVGLAVLVGVAAFTSAPGAVLLTGMLGLAVGLTASAARIEAIGTWWMVAATLWALALSFPALGARWKSDRIPQLGWLAGAAAGPLVFLPLYAAWTEGLDGVAVGALPVLLGLHGVLAAGVLVRVHGLRRTDPVLAVAVAVALAGVTFALPVQLEESWLTVGWALEAAALAWLATQLKHPLVRITAVVLGLVIAVRVLFNPWALSYGDAAGWPIVNWTLWTWGVPTLAFVVAAHFVQRSGPDKGTDWLAWSPIALRILAMFTGFALVNVEVSHLFQDAGPIELGGKTMLQGMVRSIAWGGWGMFLLVLGLGVNSRYTRFFGFSFVLLATAKVFVFDIWSLPGFIRVGSLIGLGVFLLVAAFLFERLVIRESPLSSSEKEGS